jgi:hypothetical protein
VERAFLEQNPMVIGQAEVAQLVRHRESLVPLVPDTQ